MRKKKIYMYGAVTALLPIATVATIISCGDDNSKTDQNKMDGITMDMVKKALNITPDSGVLPSSVTQPVDKSATLNGLGDVKITISNWDNGSKASKGEIDATVAVSKTGLTSPKGNPFKINWTGYKFETDQDKMDTITGDMVKTALNITVDPAALPSSVTQPTSIPPATINGLDGVEIKISTWDNQDDVKGEITATVDIAKLGLNSPSPFNIVWTGYLTTDQSKMNTITEDMVKTALNITVDPAALPSSVTQPTSIPPATINGLDGVEIKISTWDNQDDVKGEITATVDIAKLGLNSPSPFNIVWTGYLTTDQSKMNTITGDMVKTALNITVDPAALPSSVTQPTSIPPATINGLDGVEIKISTWDNQDDVKGEITATVDIAKLGLNSPSPFNIVWTGYLTTDQSKMNTITGDMVQTEIENHLAPSSTAPIPSSPPNVWTATLNQLDNVSISISSWTQNLTTGSVSMTVAISKSPLTSPNPFDINITGYKTLIMLSQINKLQYSSYNQTTGALIVNNNVQMIGNSAFYDGNYDSGHSTTVIKSIIFETNSSCIDIGDNAFSASTLTSLTIPNSVTTIGDSAFFSSTLTSLTIPNSVTTIGAYAFFSSTLTSLTIPNSVTTIGDSAFYSSTLTSLTIPNSVTTIERDAFANIANAATTHVTMPTSFYPQRDSIFPNGWDQISFD